MLKPSISLDEKGNRWKPCDVYAARWKDDETVSVWANVIGRHRNKKVEIDLPIYHSRVLTARLYDLVCGKDKVREPEYQVFYHAGAHDSTALQEMLANHSFDDRRIVSVVPVTKDGNTVGVQVITGPRE